MEITDLRHLDGVKGNFGIADGKDYGGSASVKEGHPPVELIRSNVKTFVNQQQFSLKRYGASPYLPNKK